MTDMICWKYNKLDINNVMNYPPSIILLVILYKQDIAF